MKRVLAATVLLASLAAACSGGPGEEPSATPTATPAAGTPVTRTPTPGGERTPTPASTATGAATTPTPRPTATAGPPTAAPSPSPTPALPATATSAPPTPTVAAPTAAPPTPTAPSTAPAAAAVSVEDNAFAPFEAVVRVGGSVTWTHTGSNFHNVQGVGPGYAPTNQVGFTYAVTFDAAGSYPYVCVVHPGMRGVITVR